MKNVNKISLAVFLVAIFVVVGALGYTKILPRFTRGYDKFTTDGMTVVENLDSVKNWYILDNDGKKVLYSKKLKLAVETDIYLHERENEMVYFIGERGRTIVNTETGEFNSSVSYKSFTNEENVKLDDVSRRAMAQERFLATEPVTYAEPPIVSAEPATEE